MKRVWMLVAAVVLLGAAGPGYDPQPYLHAQRLVDVGGRRMNVYCAGSGSPVVVLDAGLGGSTFGLSLSKSKLGVGWYGVVPNRRKGPSLCREG